jgi:acetyl esterase/lipase
MKHQTCKVHLLGLLLAAVASSSTFAQSNRGPRTPEGVKAHRNVAYVEDGHDRQKLDLYVPESEHPLPVIIWVHGGGWQGGSKDGCPPLRAGYTEKGFAVASIGYRLSGDDVFPAQIEDCKAAIRWLRAHVDEYGLDPERFGVWGSSAGGHLVALLGTSGDVEDFDVGPHLDQSSRVQAVCDYYGPTDFKVFVTTPRYESHARDNSPEAKLIGGAVLENPDKVARLNPTTYASNDDPPFLIVHGDTDGTVPLNQSQLLFDALKEAGVPVHFHTIHGAGHGGPAFNEPPIADMVRKFFEKRLKQGNVEPEATASESAASETPRRSPSGRPSRGIPWETILSRQDTNKDGKISKDEFRASPQLWERLDYNRDGFVTRGEHEAAFSPRSERR